MNKLNSLFTRMESFCFKWKGVKEKNVLKEELLTANKDAIELMDEVRDLFKTKNGRIEFVKSILNELIDEADEKVDRLRREADEAETESGHFYHTLTHIEEYK